MGYFNVATCIFIFLIVLTTAQEDQKLSEDSDTKISAADLGEVSINLELLTDLRKEHENALQELKKLMLEAQQAVSSLSKAIREQEKRMSTLYGAQIDLLSPPHNQRDRGAYDISTKSWSEGLRLVSTLSINATVTCVHHFNDNLQQLGLSRSGAAASSGWGMPKHLAMGDASGRVHLYSPHGQLHIVHDTGSESAVTAMSSYMLRRNESVLVTGHLNGEIRTHGVYMTLGAARGDYDISTIFLDHVLEPGVGVVNMSSGFKESQPPSAIRHMAAFRMNGKVSGRRVSAAWDDNGWLRIQRDEGTVRLSATTDGPQLVAEYRGNLLVSLSASRASVISGSLAGRLRTFDCQGLNSSRMVAAVFDPIRQYRAFALTDTREFISLIVPHETRATFCKVSRRLKISIPDKLTVTSLEGHGSPTHPTEGLAHQAEAMTTASEPSSSAELEAGALIEHGEARMTTLRGYVLLWLRNQLRVFNTSTSLKDGLHVEASLSEQELVDMLSSTASVEISEGSNKLLGVVGHSNLIAVTLGGDTLGLFESLLPIPKGMEAGSSSIGKGWTQPVLIVIMMFLAAYQFYKARGGRHGTYGQPNGARRLLELEAMGGLRAAAGARRAAYESTASERNVGGLFPGRSVRRAARMAPLSETLGMGNRGLSGLGATIATDEYNESEDDSYDEGREM
ncbi:hypothetical protein CEUSTIGMA_g10246.t1 [Chlamydomonas eustigma]|uniref:Uncharacterized protein n=1 Tax=Chlamydomonas eustigma TaxID=1157962 RepID=A0A250XJ43_9CHLO|nr:hypothetical protein CEUSTIGMA_g10246.t1 [Chlamydomonas eustigma]|eukprot:GAX82820.1 hypothetical protein CEUSTIGMA_g10246.t1 [Chlamydomonas eustigma]